MNFLKNFSLKTKKCDRKSTIKNFLFTGMTLLIILLLIYLFSYVVITHLVPDPSISESSEKQEYSLKNEDSIFTVEGLDLPINVEWIDNKRLLIHDYNKEILFLYDVSSRVLTNILPLEKNQIFDLGLADKNTLYICTYENLNRTAIDDYGTKLSVTKTSVDKILASIQENPESSEQALSKGPLQKYSIHETLRPTTCGEYILYAETSSPELLHRYYEITLNLAAMAPETSTENYSLKVIDKPPEEYTSKVSDTAFTIFKGSEQIFSTNKPFFLEPMKIFVNEERNIAIVITEQQLFVMVKIEPAM